MRTGVVEVEEVGIGRRKGGESKKGKEREGRWREKCGWGDGRRGVTVDRRRVRGSARRGRRREETENGQRKKTTKKKKRKWKTHRSNVNHQDLVLRQLLHLGLFLVVGFDTEETTKEEVVDFDLGVDRGEGTFRTEDLTDETVAAG